MAKVADKVLLREALAQEEARLGSRTLAWQRLRADLIEGRRPFEWQDRAGRVYQNILPSGCAWDTARFNHRESWAVWGLCPFIAHHFAGYQGPPPSAAELVDHRVWAMAIRVGPPTIKPQQRTTMAAETRCLEWLAGLMAESADRRPKPKSEFWDDAKVLFAGLSKRGFERVWREAIEKAGAKSWGKAGRLGKSPH